MARRHGQQLAGLVVAITGGARGIGLATAQAFQAAGARVAIGDLDRVLVEEQARRTGVLGADLDVTDSASFGRFLDLVEGELGPLGVVVNNAGIMPLGPLPEEPDHVTSRIVSVNLLGAANGTKLAMRRMVARRRGHIVNVASAVGRMAIPNAATYSASKFGVVGLTQAVRAELRGTGVHASVILPAHTRTELVSGLEPAKGQRMAEPSDVARAILATVRRPRFETWVPHSNFRSFRAMSILPLSAVEALARASGAHASLVATDDAARVAYEQRVRGQGEAQRLDVG